MVKRLLELAGIGENRLHLYWCSSAEAQRFAEIVTTVTTDVRKAGKFDPNLFALELVAAEATLSGEILRWMVGKELRITTKGDVYNRKWDTDTYEKALDQTLEREYQKNLILQAIKAGCTAPRAISKKIGLDVGLISYLLADMEKMSMVEFTGMKDSVPVFAPL
jgi:hypothetical protein